MYFFKLQDARMRGRHFDGRLRLVCPYPVAGAMPAAMSYIWYQWNDIVPSHGLD